MKSKTCCFAGHSQILKDISAPLEMAIERHITGYGVTDFLVGHYGDFDRQAAVAVRKAKLVYPGVRLFLMLPYLPGKGHALPDKEGYDDFICPEGMENVPYKWAISKLNQIMVNQSDYLIACVKRSFGGAARTLTYATAREKKGLLHIVNLAPPSP